MTNNEIYHHGILGQKWGVRRYQNEDGTLTSAGKRRYGETSGKLINKLKNYDAGTLTDRIRKDGYDPKTSISKHGQNGMKKDGYDSGIDLSKYGTITKRNVRSNDSPSKNKILQKDGYDSKTSISKYGQNGMKKDGYDPDTSMDKLLKKHTSDSITEQAVNTGRQIINSILGKK